VRAWGTTVSEESDLVVAVGLIELELEFLRIGATGL